jgi:single-strand DNA-binding protein
MHRPDRRRVRVIRAALYGCLGADPMARQTRNGNAMTTVSIAVDVGRGDGSEKTEWFSVVAFGKMADELRRHHKGDLVGLMGQLTRSRFTGRDGQERAEWSLSAESIVSARTVRPGGPRRRVDGSRQASRPSGDALPNDSVGDLWGDP